MKDKQPSMLSSGTITFLFTDIEGSTPLWESHPGEMRRALDQHNTILQQAMASHDGRVFKIVGDEFQVAFTDPTKAVKAAIDAQRQLMNASWPETTGGLRVRMGIHTGEAQAEESGDYASTHTLNRAARISAAGHGGQILISLVSAELARESLGGDVQFHDMGEHRLKGMTHPEHIFQVIVPGLQQDFPPLATHTYAHHNLPLLRTAFIGREREIAQVKSLVGSSRLVTLTGFGGIGKSRLSLQAAHELLDDYPEGVWWVELAPVSNPERVVDAIAEVLSVREQADRSLIETLEIELCDDRRLLILDNCEHLIEACAHLVDRLLASCANLHVLTSSREPLHVEGEVTLHVPALTLPKDGSTDVESLKASEAGLLFLERARAVLPDFELTLSNRQAVQQVCQRLDGIPLAIELAAARVPVMPVAQIAARLDHVFRLLTGGSRTALPRQQTLQATIDWSYQMLSPVEKNFFQRLSIFAGGWTLDAASMVCKDQAIDEYLALDLLTNLVEKSLVILDRRPGRERRYRFLETLRQYARVKLEEKGYVEIYASRHLDYYLQYAEQKAEELSSADQVKALKQMEVEGDNFRAALTWSLSNSENAKASVRMAIALGSFWLVRGNLQEGRSWMSAVLAEEATCACAEERAMALDLAAMMAYRQSDYPESKAAWEESLQISRELGQEGKSGVQLALTGLAMTASEVGDYQTAPQLLGEALEISRQLGDELGEADILRNLAWAAMRPGDYRSAREYLGQAGILFRRLNEKVGLSSTLSGLGEVATRQGELERARALLEEALELRRELDNKWGIGATLGTLGWVAILAADYAGAWRLLGESLTVRRELGDKGGIAWCLEKLALTAQLQGQGRRAARLYGAASAIRKSIDSVIDPVDQPEYEMRVADLQGILGEDEFHRYWSEGERMGVDQAVEVALGEL
jgi:predicted ATPase/class 3 adenylate cyclase